MYVYKLSGVRDLIRLGLMSAGGVLASAVALETTTYNMYIGAKYFIKSHLDYVK